MSSLSSRTPSLLALLLYSHSFSTRTPSLLALILYSHSSTRTPSLLSLLYSHSSTRTPSLLALLLYSHSVSTCMPLYSHSSLLALLYSHSLYSHSPYSLFLYSLFLYSLFLYSLSLSFSVSVTLCLSLSFSVSLSVCLSLSLLTVLSISPMYLVFNFKYHEQYENLMKFDSHVQSSSVKFQVRHPMVKNCNNVLAGNIFIIELREQFSVCLNNEAHELGCICTSHFILGKGKMPS